jgi:cytochrome c biogenesis protein CcmG/thiol:disulfide interchange protein DsbE
VRRQGVVITVLVVAALGGLFAFGLLRGEPDRDIPSELVGKPAPPFELPVHARYRDEFGETLSLADLRGRPLVVNFWASWCAPCYDEAPVLEAYWREYRDTDVLFVGIQTQDRGKRAEGTAFIERFDLSFPNLIDDDSAVSVDWALFGVPETFFVSRDGVVVDKHIGPVTPELLDRQLAALLQ